MKSLRTSFDRFCYRNRDKGIPNLMLYIVLGNAVVLIMSLFNGGNILYSTLCFDKTSILQGQVWRLITYVFTQSGSSMLELLFLYFFYMIGRRVELSMGTLKFNLFYLSGILLMDAFAMIFAEPYFAPLYWDMGYYLHMSLILMYATLNPDVHFMIFFVIPIKAWVLALIYLVIVLAPVVNLMPYFPHNLFPLIALGNYFIFTGSDIKNLMPATWRRKRQSKQSPPKRTGTIPFSPAKSTDHTHKCSVCGRTDVSNPELEFRYCSRCNGYHCYCEDHINNHTHIQ